MVGFFFSSVEQSVQMHKCGCRALCCTAPPPPSQGRAGWSHPTAAPTPCGSPYAPPHQPIPPISPYPHGTARPPAALPSPPPSFSAAPDPKAERGGSASHPPTPPRPSGVLPFGPPHSICTSSWAPFGSPHRTSISLGSFPLGPPPQIHPNGGPSF